MTEAGGGFVQRDPDAVLTAFPYTYWTNRVVSPRLSLEDPLKRVNETLAIFCGLGREVCFSLGFVQTGRHPVYDYSIKKQKEDAASRD